MIDRDGTVAHWLGEIVNGKRLYEPVNVILIDEQATSAIDARARLIGAMTVAGYPVRFGHSAGYRGLIGAEFYPQMPAGRDDAFSNRIFEESNNHGRVFGPRVEPAGSRLCGSDASSQSTTGCYIFTAAFSREQVDIFDWPGHRYASFNVARDDLAARLSAATAFHAQGYVPLDNAIAPNLRITTGDHDGRAVLLRAAP